MELSQTGETVSKKLPKLYICYEETQSEEEKVNVLLIKLQLQDTVSIPHGQGKTLRGSGLWHVLKTKGGPKCLAY